MISMGNVGDLEGASYSFVVPRPMAMPQVEEARFPYEQPSIDDPALGTVVPSVELGWVIHATVY